MPSATPTPHCYAVLHIVALSAPTEAAEAALDRWRPTDHQPLLDGEWGIVSIPLDGGRPHWLAGLRALTEADARQSWDRAWSRVMVCGCAQALVRAAPAAAPSEAPPHEAAPVASPPAQLELAHAAPAAFPHARLCVDCGGPVELYPGRDGRPRVACEACRPPEWPRRGETWWLGPVRVLVLGSRMVRPAPDAPRARRVRCRAVESGERFVVTGADWRRRASRRAPDSGEEAA